VHNNQALHTQRYSITACPTSANYAPSETSASGFFTVSVAGLRLGTYGWRVKGAKYLANAGNVTLSGAPDTQVEIGQMLVGDCNNDNVIGIDDFIILQRAFGRTLGNSRYDDRAELTGDTMVNVFDFNLMKLNFGRGGAPLIAPGGLRVRP
jgi:hypothetical protein